jgi:hypothetical protein
VHDNRPRRTAHDDNHVARLFDGAEQKQLGTGEGGGHLHQVLREVDHDGRRAQRRRIEQQAQQDDEAGHSLNPIE